MDNILLDMSPTEVSASLGTIYYRLMGSRPPLIPKVEKVITASDYPTLDYTVVKLDGYP
jgi:hypothetical protein